MERLYSSKANTTVPLASSSVVWDVHLLGDRMPGNTMVQWVLPPPQIEKNLEDNFTTLFKGHPEYARALARALQDALRAGENEADQSALLMETLQKAPLSEMLLRRWGRTLAKHEITLEAMPEGEEQDVWLFNGQQHPPKGGCPERPRIWAGQPLAIW